MKNLISKLINKMFNRDKTNIIYKLFSLKAIKLQNPKSSVSISPHLAVHHSDYGSPSVSIELDKGKLILNIMEPGSGENGTWWGIRIKPEIPVESIGSEIFILKFTISSGLEIAPGFIVKAIDNKHDTIEYANNKSKIELIHVAHPETKEIYFDLNIGEWSDTARLKKGKIIIHNLEILKTAFINDTYKNIKQFNGFFDINIEKFKLYLFELFLSKLFYQKTLSFWRNNPEGYVLKKLVNKNDIAFDVGGNWGFYTLKLSALVKHVLYFEPNPEVFPFAQNLLRECNNVTLLQLGLGKETEYKNFYVKKNLRDSLLDSGGGTFGNKLTENCPEGFITKSLCIMEGDLFESFKPGFIKIDVEGQELNVLYGLKKVLQQNSPKLLVEIDNNWNKEAYKTFSYLHRLNYSCLYFSKKYNKFCQITDDIKNNNFDFMNDSNGNYIFVSTLDKTLIMEIENSDMS